MSEWMDEPIVIVEWEDKDGNPMAENSPPGGRSPAFTTYDGYQGFTLISDIADTSTFEVEGSQEFFDSLPSPEFTVEDLNG